MGLLNYCQKLLKYIVINVKSITSIFRRCYHLKNVHFFVYLQYADYIYRNIAVAMSFSEKKLLN